MYHLYHVRMSGDPARVTSSQPEPARAPVSPWPRVLARAAPGNLQPQPQLVAAVCPVSGVLAVVVRPSRGCLAAVCGDWGLESCDCCQPAATTATVPLYRTVHCTIATVQSTTSEDTLYSIPELNLSIHTIDKQLRRLCLFLSFDLHLHHILLSIQYFAQVSKKVTYIYAFHHIFVNILLVLYAGTSAITFSTDIVITKIIFLVSFLNTEAACFGLLAPPPRPPGPQHVTRHVLGLVTRDTWPRDLTSHVTTTSTGGCPLARPLYVNRSRYITHAVDVDCNAHI